VSSISGSAIQYGGGGGGGVYTSGTYFGGLGGGGGGGNGGTAASGSAAVGFTGMANTGGGAGASSGNASATAGAAGGSGIVILRYPSYLAPATSTTGSPETYVTGAWRVYRFVANGTITF
jgi:hypothetical protein